MRGVELLDEQHEATRIVIGAEFFDRIVGSLCAQGRRPMCGNRDDGRSGMGHQCRIFGFWLVFKLFFFTFRPLLRLKLTLLQKIFAETF